MDRRLASAANLASCSSLDLTSASSWRHLPWQRPGVSMAGKESAEGDMEGRERLATEAINTQWGASSAQAGPPCLPLCSPLCSLQSSTALLPSLPAHLQDP